MYKRQPYRSFKDLRIQRSDGSIVIAVLGVIVLAAKPTVTFFLVALAYAAHGPVSWYYRYRTGRSLEAAAASPEAPQESGS